VGGENKAKRKKVEQPKAKCIPGGMG
jgi:hypothetical protein